jgi:hypothetical protein
MLKSILPYVLVVNMLSAFTLGISGMLAADMIESQFWAVVITIVVFWGGILAPMLSINPPKKKNYGNKNNS